MKSIFTLSLIVFCFTVSSQTTFVNPVNHGQDPYVIKKDGYYYFLQSDGGSLLLWKSDKLTDMGIRRRILNLPLSGWNTSDLWAPELQYINNTWYIYYTVGTANGNWDDQRSGVYECTTQDPMTGSWVERGMLYTGDNYYQGIIPTVNNTHWAIDLTPFELNGQLYCLWSGWANNTPNGNGGHNQNIYIATMSNPWTISSSRVLISTPTLSFETLDPVQHINEGPQVLVHNSTIYVIYSCNGFSTLDYKLGQLSISTSSNPMVPSSWTKKSTSVFTGNANVYSVGHASFTTSPDDSENWIFYHSKLYNDNSSFERDVRLQSFTWNMDGSPNFGTPLPKGTSMNVPSGEQNNVGGTIFYDDFSTNNWDNWRYYGWDNNIDCQNNELHLGLMTQYPQFHFGEKALVRGFDWSDFIMEGNVKIEEGTRDAGFVFRASEPAFGWDAYKGYFAGIIEDENKIYLARMDGSFHLLTQASVVIDPNNWYSLKVEARGSTINLYINGTLYITYSDNTYTSGMNGVRGVETHCAFDDISIMDFCIANSPSVYLGNDTTITSNQVLTLDANAGFQSYLWNDNSTNQMLSVNANTLGAGTYNYWVAVTNNLSCTKRDSIIVTVDLNTTIEDKTEGGVLTYYSALSNTIHIGYKGNNLNIEQIILYDIMGKKIRTLERKELTEVGHTMTFDAGSLPNGIYLIGINTESSYFLKKLRVVK